MDENFYQQITAHIDRLQSGQERTRFLSDLAFLCARGKIPAAQKEAFLAYIRQYYIPLDRSGNLDPRCEHRMKALTAVREESYRALGAAYNKDADDRMKELLDRTAADETAQYAYKTDALLGMLAESLGGRNARSKVREWRALKNSEFRTLPIIEGFDVEKYEAVKADAAAPQEVKTAPVPEAALNPEQMLSLITGSVLHQNYAKRDGDVKEKIRFGQVNNPFSRNFELQYPAAKERIEKMKADMDRSMQGSFWGFLTDEHQRNRMREAHATNYRVNFLKKEYGNGYFLSEVSRDQKNAALSFGRKGSAAFQDMETQVNRLKEMLQEAGRTESLGKVDGRNLRELLGDIMDRSRTYCRTKLNVNGRQLQVDQLTNSNTRKRVRYALRVEEEARNLLNRLRNLDAEEERRAKDFQVQKEREQEAKEKEREENRENYFKEQALKNRELARKNAAEDEEAARKKAPEDEELARKKAAEEQEAARKKAVLEQEAKDRQRYNRGLGKYYREKEMKQFGFLPKEITGLRNRNTEAVAGRSGTFDGILVPEDFREAAKASDLADRVSFEKQADGRYRMTPKFPEKGKKVRTGPDGETVTIEFAIRKNVNFLVKGMAEHFLSHAKSADGSPDPSKGLDAVSKLREEFIGYRVQGGENSYNKLAGMLNIPPEDQEDFIRFMKYTDVPGYFSSMAGEMVEEAAEANRNTTGSGLDPLTERLQRAASIDPATETKMILPYHGSGNGEMIAYLGFLASGKGSPDDTLLPAGLADYDRKLAETREYLEKLRKGTAPARREKPRIHSAGEAMLAVDQVRSVFRDPERVRDYLRSSPLITEEERNELEPLLRKTEDASDTKAAEVFEAKFSGIVKKHREYVQKNSEYLLGIISAELELRKEEQGQKAPDGEKRDAALLGTVRYQGKDCIVVFDQPRSGNGSPEAKIGIYNNFWELQYMPQLEEKIRRSQSMKKADADKEEQVVKMDFRQLKEEPKNPEKKTAESARTGQNISVQLEEEIPKIRRRK